MKGEYWFNSEPILKNVDIIFEYEKYQFVNDVVRSCSIDELKEIIHAIKKHLADTRPYTFSKEYIWIHVAFSYCAIEYELPHQTYSCYITCLKMAEILETYVDIYVHLEDRFKL